MIAPSTDRARRRGRTTVWMNIERSAATSAASSSWTVVVVLPPSAASIAARTSVDGRDSARWMKSWLKARPWIPSIRRAAVLILVM
jgi:hypothetical protein